MAKSQKEITLADARSHIEALEKLEDIVISDPVSFLRERVNLINEVLTNLRNNKISLPNGMARSEAVEWLKGRLKSQKEYLFCLKQKR